MKKREVVPKETKLPADKLNSFKRWLKKNGWTIEKSNRTYEILRARLEGRNMPLALLQKKNDNDFYYVYDRDSHYLVEFLSK